VIGVVYREFCPDSRCVREVVRITREDLKYMRNIRVCDTGTITMAGYSAGSRNNLMFGWANNVDSAAGKRIEGRLTSETCNVFALFWNLCKSKLPGVVVKDFEKFLYGSNISRMDGGLKAEGGDGLGSYALEIGGRKFEFSGEELAPPAGVLAGNYSRAIHRENQPHEYAVGWCLTRDAPISSGGNFFVSEYGIRIEQEANTVIVWKPRHYHGTSLHDVVPRSTDWVATGICFVTSSKLLGSWEAYQKSQINGPELQS
ncbi:hypothetical protein BDN72DRAFT_739065, partial [Pluteus cervinus]